MKSLLLAHNAFKKNVESRLRKFGLHPGNPKMLVYISDHEGCRQKDLAETFYMETCTLSSVLANMEDNRLIERERAANDKRSYAIYTTPKTKQMINDIRAQFDHSVEVALTGFTDEEATQFREYLARATKNLMQANKNL